MPRTYLLKLYQVQRSLTDSYSVEADDEAQARTQGEEIAKARGLKDFEFEVEDLSTKSGAGAVEPEGKQE